MLRFVPLLLAFGVAFSSLEHDLARAPQARIINGRAAQKDRFPWFVRTIGSKNSKGEFQACAASLIAPDLIVTAAHCEPPVTAQVSAYDATNFDTSRQRQVVQSVRHPNYPQGAEVNFDIMISKLASPIADVEPIKMNFDESYPSKSGEELKIMGFGSTIPGPDAPIQQSRILQIAPTGYVPFRECAVAEDPETGNKYGNSPQNTMVEDWWLCTLYNDPLITGTCFGDSGGPVFRQGKNLGTDLLVGVISGASGYCGNPNLPLWNNRVSYFQDWFVDTGCAMSDNPPAYWNCGGGSGGGRGGGEDGEDSSIWIIVAVVLGLIAIAALVFFFWRRNKRHATKPISPKKKKFDVEQPPPPRSGGGGLGRARERTATEVSSPANSEADMRKEPLNDGTSPPARRPSGMFARRPSFDAPKADPPPRRPSGMFTQRPSQDGPKEQQPPRKPSGLFARMLSMDSPKEGSKPSPEPKSPLVRRPSGLFNKKPATDTNDEEEKPSSFFGRKMSLNDSKPKEDKEPGMFERKLSLDSLPDWLTTKPAFLDNFNKKDDDDDDDDDSFVPPEIADMVKSMEKELDDAAGDRSKRDRRSSDPPPRSRDRSRSVDRRRASDFADRRGRGISRDATGRRSSPSKERPRLSNDRMKRSASSDRGRGQSREPPASRRPSRSRERTQPGRRSSSSDNARLPRSRSRSAEPRKPQSSGALGSRPSRETRTGPKKSPPPRSRSDTVPGTSKRPSFGDRGSFTKTPVSRTKSDVVSTAPKPASTRQAMGARPKAAPKASPTPRASSGFVSPFSSTTQSGAGRKQPSSPKRAPPPRTQSDSTQNRSSRQPLPSRSSAPESSYKSVFDQWKQREESAKPIITKNADGTVTVAKSRRNAEGVRVITKTNYASLDLARRHGVDI